MPEPALAHAGQDELGQRDRPEVVDLELVADLVEAQLLGGRDGAPAGVVDEHVDAAVVGEHPVDAGARGLVVGDVEGADVELDAGLGRGVGQGGGPARVAHRRDDGEAATGQLDRGVQAHARGGSGDEGDRLPVGVHAGDATPATGPGVDVVELDVMHPHVGRRVKQTDVMLRSDVTSCGSAMESTAGTWLSTYPSGRAPVPLREHDPGTDQHPWRRVFRRGWRPSHTCCLLPAAAARCGPYPGPDHLTG